MKKINKLAKLNTIINESFRLDDTTFLEELQQLWYQYQPRMTNIQRTTHYKHYVEYLDARYENDYRTFLFIENIFNNVI